MIDQFVAVQPFDRLGASDDQYRALNTFENQIRAERLPGDPPVPLEEDIQSWRSFPPYVDMFIWVVWAPDGSTIIARGEAIVPRLDTNQHVLDFQIAVLPEFRQQGLARVLLSPIVEKAQQEERRLLTTLIEEHLTDRVAFLQSIGASRAWSGAIHQLATSNVDRELLQRWQTEAAADAPAFELGFWAGAYPEEQLATMAQLHDEANPQTRGQLEMEDYHFKAEQLRQREEYYAAVGDERWTLYIAEQQTGHLVGFCEAIWNPNRPQGVWQHASAVYPEYNVLKLGRWLKAAMLEKIMHERPQVQVVRIGKGDTDDPLSKLDQELGFTPDFPGTIWQVETKQAVAYLSHVA